MRCVNSDSKWLSQTEKVNTLLCACFESEHTRPHTRTPHAPKEMYLTDVLPSDVTAAALGMLDARDVLRAFQAIPTLALPTGWVYQAHRPLREIEEQAFGVVGAPLRLWPTCPIVPDGLVCLYRNAEGMPGFAVHEDVRGNLYVDTYGSRRPFHCWCHVVHNTAAMWKLYAVQMGVTNDNWSNWTNLLWINNMSARDRSRLRAMRELDPSNLYDYEARAT